MNKSQRIRRKRSDESSAIFKGKFRNYENILSYSWTFVFCYTNCKYFLVLLHLKKLKLNTGYVHGNAIPLIFTRELSILKSLKLNIKIRKIMGKKKPLKVNIKQDKISYFFLLINANKLLLLCLLSIVFEILLYFINILVHILI